MKSPQNFNVMYIEYEHPPVINVVNVGLLHVIVMVFSVVMFVFYFLLFVL